MIVARTIKNSYVAVALLQALYTFLFQSIFSYNFSVEINTHYLICTAVSAIFLLFLILLIFCKETISFSLIDVFVTFIFIVGLLHVLFGRPDKTVHNGQYLTLLAMTMLFFIARFSATWIVFYFLPIIISIFFLFEIYLGITQLLTVNYHAKNLSLAISGSLENSGVYSIYLCVSLPLFYYTMHICSFMNKKIRIVVFGVAISLVGCILFCTISRTAILMLRVFFSGCLYYQCRKLPVRKLTSGFLKKISFFIVCIVTLTGAGWLYYLKPASSLGRLFIWKVTGSYVCDNFFSGIGIGNFSYQYLLWQIDYVASHSIKANKWLNIDETKIAYNEFLQLFAETGIIGFSIFTLILYHLFKLKPTNNHHLNFTLKATLVLILISAFTSYPFHCNSILFLFIICAAGLLKLNQSSFRYTLYNQWHLIIGLYLAGVITCIIFIYIFQEYRRVKQWEDIRENYFITKVEKIKQYEAISPNLLFNGKFLLDYGEYLLATDNPARGLEIIEKSKEFYISERTYISATEGYSYLGNMEKAIENAQNWSLLIPYKFYPKAALVKLYLLKGDTSKAKGIASIILKMPVKIPSSEVDAIKEQMKSILNEK
ncbi:MAG: O-antigen ligase family protein [Agriterribacter sp.]